MKALKDTSVQWLHNILLKEKLRYEQKNIEFTFVEAYNFVEKKGNLWYLSGIVHLRTLKPRKMNTPINYTIILSESAVLENTVYPQV